MGGQEPAIVTIHAFYLANRMVLISGGPFGANLAGTVWSHDEGAEGARADDVGAKSIRLTMKRLIVMAEALKQG